MAHTRAPLPTQDQLAALPPDGGPEFNRLVFEHSPYLLQHAANPVDWWPWGDAAFDEARRRDVPVFLSIGYATCHWCHVMEHESFEDAEVAALMNDAFVCIKVDREERPDIDQVYMTVTQAMTGRGGWPMTVILTPDRRPFFAGTYFPKSRSMYGVGMMQLVPALTKAWRDERSNLISSADRIVEAIAGMSGGAPGAIPLGVLDLALEQFDDSFDEHNGGFGDRPKFPVPHDHRLLLRLYRRGGDLRSRRMVDTTLRAMRLGGIWDHVGFGFHRYSTDEVWLLPHFEKMLYDQAGLLLAYAEAAVVLGDASFRQTASEIAAYVLRDMTAPEGGFYSAEDADSEGVEGKFYVWRPEEIDEVLGADDSAFLCETLRIAPGGNYYEESSGHRPGDNIPHLRAPITDTDRARFEAARARLFQHREARIHPLKDDKVLTDWNGLMIAALSRAGSLLGDAAMVGAARRAADFVLANLRGPDGRLLKRWRNGHAGLPAHLEDYAFLALGLLELYEATFDPRDLAESLALCTTMRARFADAHGGGFFLTADDGEPLIVRSKDLYDGAIPSGNSVAANVFARLGRLLGDESMLLTARGTLEAFAQNLAKAPRAHSQALMAHAFMLEPGTEVVIAGALDDPEVQRMAAVVRRAFLPDAVVVHLPPGGGEVVRLVPWLAALQTSARQPTAFVCRNRACELPVHTAADLAQRLGVEAAPPSA